MKRVFPAIIERCRKPNIQRTASTPGDSSIRSTSSRFVEPCRSIARSLKKLGKSHQRKSILPGNFTSDYQARLEVQPKAQPALIRPAVGNNTVPQKQRGGTLVEADSCFNGGHKLQDLVDAKAAEEPSSSAALPKLLPGAERPQRKEDANLAEGPGSAPMILEQQQSQQQQLSAPELPPRPIEKSQHNNPVPPEDLPSPVKEDATSQAADTGPPGSNTVPGLS